MTLPTTESNAAQRGRDVQRSSDRPIPCLPGAQQQTHRTPLLRSIGGTETDGRTLDRFIDAGSVNKKASTSESKSRICLITF